MTGACGCGRWGWRTTRAAREVRLSPTTCCWFCAAEAGQGIALVREIHARAEIASGRLAVALERPWPSRFAYYAVSLPGAAQRAPLSLFLARLREQAAAEA